MDRSFPGTVFFIWSGLLIWAADFLFLYVFAALACARGFAHAEIIGLPILQLVTVLASSVALAANALLIRRARAKARQTCSDQHVQFVLFLAVALGALGMLAILWNALPPLMLTAHC